MFTARRKEELLSQIEEGFPDKEAYIPRIVGMDILLALLEKGVNLRTIMVPPSIYPTVSERVKSHLKETRISLEKGREPPGRPFKYGEDEIKKIVQLKEKKVPITQISRELRIPRRTIYYLLKERKLKQK